MKQKTIEGKPPVKTYTQQAVESYQESLQYAQSKKHDNLSTAHILMGLIKQKNSYAVQILKSMGYNPKDIMEVTNKMIEKKENKQTGEILNLKMTENAKFVLVTGALKESEYLSENSITTIHILLAITQCKSTANQILKTLPITENQLKTRIFSNFSIELRNKTVDYLYEITLIKSILAKNKIIRPIAIALRKIKDGIRHLINKYEPDGNIPMIEGIRFYPYYTRNTL